MKLLKSMLFCAAALALAAPVVAADKNARKNDPGFNVLDKDRDGSLSRTEATGNPELLKRFKQADRNNDGKLSRMEYLTVMTKKDVNTAKQKLSRNKDKEKSAATGGTKPK